MPDSDPSEGTADIFEIGEGDGLACLPFVRGSGLSVGPDDAGAADGGNPEGEIVGGEVLLDDPLSGGEGPAGEDVFWFDLAACGGIVREKDMGVEAMPIATSGRVRLVGSDGDDRVPGGAGNDLLYGARGHDLLLGGGGDDALFGGSGSDDLRGGLGRDVLRGGQGSDDLGGGRGGDVLLGGAGDDLLAGGGGNDRLRGGAGADILRGGDGADRFIFTAAGPMDRIADFGAGDRIDLSRLDANLRLAGDQAFTFLGGEDFGGRAGEARFEGGFVEADRNGDGLADFRIEVTGAAVIEADDFLL